MKSQGFSNFLSRLAVAVATGYIWFFYSERVFWSYWRVGEDTVPIFLLTWVVYSVAAYIGLILIQEYKARSVWALFLVGAVFGWLIEGVFAMTFFGTAEIPFPLTISWTALAWHALISVVFGWYVLQQALLHSLKRTAVVSLSLGTFWGLWSLFWFPDAPGGPIPVQDFLLYALAITTLLMLAQRVYPKLNGQFRATRLEKLVLAVLVLGWYGVATVPTFGVLALTVLPAVFGVAYVALYKNKKTETQTSILATFSAKVPWGRSFAVLLMPAAAVVVYGLAVSFNAFLLANFLVLAVTLPAGFVLFCMSVWKVWRVPKRS